MTRCPDVSVNNNRFQHSGSPNGDVLSSPLPRTSVIEKTAVRTSGLIEGTVFGPLDGVEALV